MIRIAALCLIAAIATLASGQSLGDVARQNRAAKRPQATKVITNDDVASSAPKDASPAPQPQQPAREKISTDIVSLTEKQYAEYRKRADEAKAAIAKLQRELAQVERDRLVQATNAYMDAGARLRDSRAWTEQRQKLDEDVTKKSNELAAARQKLDDLREEARKAGIPAAIVE